MFKVGDSVVANHYPGTVTAVLDNGGIAVRLASGEIELDAADVLPGEVWPQLVKMGESDARKARKEGSILIAGTVRGTVDLRYNATEKRFEGTIADELNPRSGHVVVNATTIKAAGLSAGVVVRCAQRVNTKGRTHGRRTRETAQTDEHVLHV